MAQERQSETSLSIVRNENGAFVFEGTRIFITQIISRVKVIGDLEEAESEFVDGYPRLSHGHFRAAISYYEVNQEEIDREIEREGRLRTILNKHANPTVDVETLLRDPDYQRITSS